MRPNAFFLRVILLPAVLALALAPSPALASGAHTTRSSVSSRERQGNANSYGATISAGGRYVVFESNASNLVPGDTNGVADIFERDRVTGKTIRVSVSSRGAQANGPSHSTRGLSADGRYVVFESFATNLAAHDFNGQYDVFERDTVAHKTYLISVSSSGRHGNGASSDPVVSASGRYVAFEAQASNLVGNDTNGWTDVYLRDRVKGKTVRVSVSSAGRQGNGNSSDPSISANGRLVAYESQASNLVGRDTNAREDILVRDMVARKTTRASVASSGAQARGGSYTASISPDGRFVGFESFAPNLVRGDTNKVADVFLHNRRTGRTTRVSVSSRGHQGNSFSSDPAVSSRGRYVTFESNASNLVGRDTNLKVDVLVRDVVHHRTIRASVASSGRQGNGESSDPSITSNGALVAYESQATTLVPGDTNRHADVFVRGPIG